MSLHDNGAHVWVIDPAKASVVATIVIPGAPEFMVYDEAADRIYLNIKSKDVVAVIDPSTNKVIAQWPTAPATLPHGLAFDAGTHQLFSSGGSGKLVAIDTKTGAVTGSIDIAQKVDQIAFDAAGARLYCAGADKMSVISTAGGKLKTLGDTIPRLPRKTSRSTRLRAWCGRRIPMAGVPMQNLGLRQSRNPRIASA